MARSIMSPMLALVLGANVALARAPMDEDAIHVGISFPLSGVPDGEEFFALGTLSLLDFGKQQDPPIRPFYFGCRSHDCPGFNDSQLIPPALSVPNPHPDLFKLKVHYDDTGLVPNRGARIAIDYILGNEARGHPPMNAVIGAFEDTVTTAIANILTLEKLVQVNIYSTSEELRDKTGYPYLFRTVQSSRVAGIQMWDYIEFFQWRGAHAYYEEHSYGIGARAGLADSAAALGRGGEIFYYAVNVESAVQVVGSSVPQIKASQHRLIVSMIWTDWLVGRGMRAAWNEAGIRSPNFQFIVTVTVQWSLNTLDDFQNHTFWHSFASAQDFTSPSVGTYLTTWFHMTAHDVISRIPEYTAHWEVPYNISKVTKVNDALFQGPPKYFGNVLEHHAAFQILLRAFNNMLHDNYRISELHGDTLKDYVKNVSFFGFGKQFGFNEFQDTSAPAVIVYYDVPTAGTPNMVPYAVWEPINGLEGTLSMMAGVDAPKWATGERTSMPPLQLRGCTPGFFVQKSDQDDIGTCEPCPGGRFSDTFDAETCTKCAGGTATSQGSSSCATCAPGTFAAQGSIECTRCFPGSFAESAGLSSCTSCPVGHIGNAELGATSCTPCKNGTFRAPDAVDCAVCPLGKFASSRGQSACEYCPEGRFAAAEGAVVCNPCGEGRSSSEHFTTMAIRNISGVETYVYEEGSASIDRCGCNIGYRYDASGECTPCTDGMQCLGMGDIRIIEGYYADFISETEDILVYKCHGAATRCVGGLPGSTCALGREGLLCGRCMDEKTPASDGTCVQCGDVDYLPMAAVIVLAGVVLVATYHYIDTQDHAVKNTVAMVCAIALGQTLTVMQQLAVVSEMSIDWKEPLKTAIEFLSLMAFDLDLLRPSCISSQRPVQVFAMKVGIIYLGIVAILIIHTGFVIFRHHCQCWARTYVLGGMLGTLFMVLYLAVTSTVLQPLQCVSHPSPNSHWTVRSYPDVICWESSDHSLMCMMSILSFLTAPVLYLTMVVVVVMKFPAQLQAGDSRFLKTFSFLFFRFRPSCYAFALVHTARSFLIAVISVIPDTVTQLIVLQVVLLSGFSATLYVMPWTVSTGNLIDLVTGFGMIIFVLVVSFFLEDDLKKLSSLSFFAVVLLTGLMVLLPLAACKAVYLKFGRRRKPFEFFLTHHKAASGAYTRLLKMHIIEKGRLRSRSVFLDSDNLDNLDRLFSYVGNDTATVVVICTEQVFSRPWCVGEVVTAMLKEVSMLVIMLPGGVLPSDAESIEKCVKSIVDWRVLTENGMQDATVRQAFVWVSEQPIIKVPGSAEPAVISSLVDKLVAKTHADLTANNASRLASGKEGEGRSTMIFDWFNFEAAASAWILKRMLAPIMTSNVEGIPRPMEMLCLPPNLVSLVVICTNGLLENVTIANMLITIPESIPCLLPVVCEANFRFPSAREDQGEGLLSIVASFTNRLFKEIAINFLAQSASNSTLEFVAKTVVLRLPAHRSSKKISTVSSSSFDGDCTRTTDDTAIEGTVSTERQASRAISAHVPEHYTWMTEL